MKICSALLSFTADDLKEERMKKRFFYTTLIGIAFAALAVLLIGPARTKSFQGEDRSQVSGVVASKFGMVAKARVRIAGSSQFTLTDINGRFTLQTPPFPARPLQITAGKKGWFNNSVSVWPGSRGANIQLYPLPQNDNPGYRHISPNVCAQCHNTLSKYWDKSKMAHATSNGKTLNMYNGTDATGRTLAGPGYKLDNPDKTGNCTFCHAPSSAFTRTGAKDIESALWSSRTEWDGISCDYCHKTRNVVKSNDTPSLYKPIFKRNTPFRGNSILVLGPYDDVVNTAMSASFSPVYDKGIFCATCHSQVRKLPDGQTWDRKKVYADQQWENFNIGNDSVLPVQTTFQEWRQWQDSLKANDSNKEKSCQDCHMSWRKEMLPYDEYVVDGNARNMWGVKRDPENIRPHHFDGGTETQLKTALSMEIQGTIRNDILEVIVYISNTNGGHWVPTGDPMRHIMLLVSAEDSSENRLELISGQTLPAWTGTGPRKQGNYAGLPGKVFSKILADSAGKKNVPFWQADTIIADTRIKPKTTVTAKFKFKINNPDDEPMAFAKLIYRPFTKSLARIKKWDVKDILITETAW